MDTLSTVNSWQRIILQLDDYAEARKSELGKRQLTKDSSLIKSYMIETQPNGIDITKGSSHIANLLRSTRWDITPLDEDNAFRVTHLGELSGFIEVVSDRYFVFHTMLKSQEIDALLRRAVRASAKLDSVWLAGSYLNLLWEQLIEPYRQNRFTSLRFEYESRFGSRQWDTEDIDDTEDDSSEREDTSPISLDRDRFTLALTSPVSKISRFLPELQNIMSDFRAIRMVRYPSVERGGYDFWDWGKVTHRAPSFREGIGYLHAILQQYWRATVAIEERVWYQLERTTMKSNSDYLSITGTPITFVFPEPLSPSTFETFIETTFRRGQGPFRLWGDPLAYNSKKVHIYGVDLHLWQKIYLELTPNRFIAVLPHGTCGNTIHRLVSNIQRYLATNVEVFIGDQPYTELIRAIFLSESN